MVRFLIEFLEIQHDFGIQTWPVIPGDNTMKLTAAIAELLANDGDDLAAFMKLYSIDT